MVMKMCVFKHELFFSGGGGIMGLHVHVVVALSQILA